MQGISLPSGARLTGHVHRLTPSDESGAQKDGQNASVKPCKAILDADSREDSATGGERPAH